MNVGDLILVPTAPNEESVALVLEMGEDEGGAAFARVLMCEDIYWVYNWRSL